MSARKRRNRRSPGRSSTLGLFLVLVVAVAVGVLVGGYIGRQSPPPYVPARTAAALPPVKTAAPSPQRHDASHGPSADAPRASNQPSNAPPPTAEPPTAETPSVEKAAPAKPRPRRAAGYTGELVRCAGSSKVALTFDAGASPEPTPAILSALRTAGVHSTFFLTGKWSEQNPALVRRMAAEGHEIANHTYSHPDLRKLTDEQIADQLAKTDEILRRTAGQGVSSYFRPPFGGRDKRVLSAASQAGYSAVYWSLDSWDSFKKGITSREISERVLGRVEGGDIVLMHCGSAATAQALPGIIEELRRRGLEPATISELAEQ